MKRRPISKAVRFRVLARDEFRCYYCGASVRGKQLEIDHRVPVALGGTNDEMNLVAACIDCNRGKRAAPLPQRDFLGWLRRQRLRDDWIGDLADDEERSPLRDPTSLDDLLAQLGARNACGAACEAAEHAWREWQEGRPTPATRQTQAHMENLAEMAKPGELVWMKTGFWTDGTFHPFVAVRSSSKKHCNLRSETRKR